VFTAQQAAAGRTAYETGCAACHQVDLGGSNEAPQLAGGSFIGQWGDRSASDLIAYITTAMPPTNPGGPGQPAITNIVAYILQANGAVPGSQPLTPQTASAIRSVAMQQAPLRGPPPRRRRQVLAVREVREARTGEARCPDRSGASP